MTSCYNQFLQNRLCFLKYFTTWQNGTSNHSTRIHYRALIQTLRDNPNLVIELASHTDTRDSEERNDILSQRRAQSVVDYLIIRGIDPNRLVAKGYGEHVPLKLKKDVVRDGYLFKAGTVLDDDFINSLPTNSEKEAAHQMNRRTEFRVLRKDYVPESTNLDMTDVNIMLNPDDNSVRFREEAIQDR